MTTTTDRIRTYFDRAARPDIDAYLALFATDAMVEDEAHDHHGHDAICAWRAGVVPVAYDVVDIATADTSTAGGTTTARVSISGDFPGSPVTLLFRFTFAGERIARLTIRPEGDR